MNEIQIFNYEGKDIRAIQKDNEPWWILKDVCDVLSLTNSRMVADRLDEDEKGVSIIDTLGGKQELTIINESGIYNVILLSRKPEAKKFKRWVTHEVLPTIRKTGGYVANEDLFINTYLPHADEPTKLMFKTQLEVIKNLNNKIELDRPKVVFANAVAAAETSILIGDLAKLLKQNGIETGQKRLFSWLRENGYLIKRKGADYNSPTQKAMEMGLFEMKETAVALPDDHVRINKTTKVTGKGQQYFINLFLQKKGA